MKLPWNKEQAELDREVAYHIEHWRMRSRPRA